MIFAANPIVPMLTLQEHQRQLDIKRQQSKKKAVDAVSTMPTVLEEEKQIQNDNTQEWDIELVPLLRQRLASMSGDEKKSWVCNPTMSEASRKRIEDMMVHNAPLLEELGNEVAAFFYEQGTLTMYTHQIPSLVLVLKDIVELHMPLTQNKCRWNKDEWLLFLKDFVIVLVETQLLSVPSYERLRIETMLVDSILLLDASLEVFGVGFCQKCREPQNGCCCCQFRCVVS
jgi:hypothetical protein